jgi:death on curing protein
MSAIKADWIWIAPAVIEAVHDAQLAEHGGLSGTRDAGMLASALGRAQNLALYGTPDASDLAAAYGYGISRNHAFFDGNKRTGFVAVELFLALNGWELVASDADSVFIMLQVAAGDITEEAFAAWIRAHWVARVARAAR